MSTLYSRYRKLGYGGTPDPNKFGNAAIAGAGLGTSLIDAFDTPNEYGNQSSAGMIGKSALQMGAAGAAIGGPVGAAIGGGLGIVTGFIGAGKARQQENDMKMQKRNQQGIVDANNSAARIAGNTSLVQGYRNSQMFAGGGTLPSIKVNNPAVGVNTDNDTMPSYFNYIKSIQNKNPDGANLALNHIRDVRGPQMATNMQFLGKQLGTSNIQDIARRSMNETDPQMKSLYATLRENPGIIDTLDYGTEHKVQSDLAKHASGGNILPPVVLPSAKEKYRTKLSTQEQPLYNAWKSKLPTNLQWDKDYDLQGLWKENPNVQPSGNLHFTDKYKRPNHPTFSNESQYFNDRTKQTAGHWKETPTEWDYLPYDTNVKKPIVEKKASGGTLEAPLTKAYMIGGYAKPTSSSTTEIEGNTHDEGGVKIPSLGSEVEDGETTSGNFVFSKELGFAKLHKPIAKAMGIIEKKPQTTERINAMKLLKGQENKLALTQEYFKKSQGIA